MKNNQQPPLIQPGRTDAGPAPLNRCAGRNGADETRFLCLGDPAEDKANIAAGRMPDAHRVLPAGVTFAADDEPPAIDITRLDKTEPADRRRINNAWRTLKADAPAEAADIGAKFAALRERFPDAGIEVPVETLERES